MRKDNQLVVVTHICQLLTFVTGFGGLIVPLILWLTQKEKVENMDEHGRAILNFQVSLIIYSIISIPLTFILVGFVMLGLIAILGIVFPIVNAVNASNGKEIYYPLSLPLFGDSRASTFI